MKTVSSKSYWGCSEEDLLYLKHLSRHAYAPNITLEDFIKECAYAYVDYVQQRDIKLNFPAWINGQIIQLTTL